MPPARKNKTSFCRADYSNPQIIVILSEAKNPFGRTCITSPAGFESRRNPANNDRRFKSPAHKVRVIPRLMRNPGSSLF